MRLSLIAAAGVATALAVPAATAQVVGLGTTKGGVLDSVSVTVAKVVSTHAGLQMRTEPMGGTQQYIPIVNAGQLDFGMSNAMQYSMAYNGTGLSQGQKYDNLRVVAQLMVFRTAPIVPRDSDIKTVADIKGKRVPYGFKGAPLFQTYFTGYLANGGLTWDDVVKVPVVGLRQQWDAMKQGKVEFGIGQPGSSTNIELNSTVPNGGIRHLSLDTETPGAKKMLSIMPQAFYITMQPDKKYPAVVGPTTVMGLSMLVFTHKGAADDVVYKVAKTFYDQEAEFKATSPVWETYGRDGVAPEIGMPYHPGAEKAYREKGVYKAG